MDGGILPTSLDVQVWTLLADTLAAGQGPWREGELVCFSEPGTPWVHPLTLCGVNAASHTLCGRGLPVTLENGDLVLWTFSDPRSGLRATFEGQAVRPLNPYRGTWRVRVVGVTLSWLDGPGRRQQRVDYGQPLPLLDDLDTLR